MLQPLPSTAEPTTRQHSDAALALTQAHRFPLFLLPLPVKVFSPHTLTWTSVLALLCRSLLNKRFTPI